MSLTMLTVLQAKCKQEQCLSL